MDTNQKSVENVGPSQSSSSRRVMWQGRDDEEEVYDSIVTYKTFTKPRQAIDSSSTNSEHEQQNKSQTLKSSDENCRLCKKKEASAAEESASKSSTSLALRYKPSHESLQDVASNRRSRARGCWHHLVNRMCNKTKMNEKASPSLALRYKPSHESIEDHCSKEQLTGNSKTKLATADLKLETCFVPSYQTAVVREVAPMFANRMCLVDDSESGCSGSLELRIPLVKSPKRETKELSCIDQKCTKTKRRTKTAASSSGATSKGSSDTNAMPNLRQRQQELHRYRVLIEKRRLELLDLKIVRERAEALRHEILFHKDLQLKHNQIKSYEDNNSSQA